MKNINRNAKTALYTSEKPYLSHSHIEELVIGSEQPFSIEASFVIRNMSDGYIYSQENGFQFGIEKDQLYFQLKGFGKVEQDMYIQLNTNELYFVAVTYGAEKFALYLNGTKIGSGISSSSISEINKGNYRIGYGLDCYIVDLRLLSVQLTKDEIMNDFVNGLCEHTETHFWGDFTTQQYRDISSNNLGLWVSDGIATCVNVCGCTKLNANGGFFLDKTCSYEEGYSVLCKFYPFIEANQKMYLYSVVETKSKEAVFSLCVQSDGQGGKVICAENGGNLYQSSCCLAMGEWIDAALNVQNQEASVYIDGEKQFSFHFIGSLTNVMPMIGIRPNLNRKGYAEGFRGYLSYVAEFSAALSDEQIDFFANEQPYMFEDKLSANYLFCSGNPLEIITGTDLYSVGNAEFIYEKQLNALTAETGINMHIPDTVCEEWLELSEYDKWLITVTMDSIRKVYADTYGIKMNSDLLPIEQVATPQITKRFSSSIKMLNVAASSEEILTAADAFVETAAATSAAGGSTMVTGVSTSGSFLNTIGPVMAVLASGLAVELAIILSKGVCELIEDNENNKPENERAELKVLDACCNHQGNPAVGSIHFHSDVELKEPKSMEYSKVDGKIDMDMFLIPPKIESEGILFSITVINSSSKTFAGSIFTEGSRTFAKASTDITLLSGEKRAITFRLSVMLRVFPNLWIIVRKHCNFSIG